MDYEHDKRIYEAEERHESFLHFFNKYLVFLNK